MNRTGYVKIQPPCIITGDIIGMTKTGGYFNWRKFRNVPEIIYIYTKDSIYAFGEESVVSKITFNNKGGK